MVSSKQLHNSLFMCDLLRATGTLSYIWGPILRWCKMVYSQSQEGLVLAQSLSPHQYLGTFRPWHFPLIPIVGDIEVHETVGPYHMPLSTTFLGFSLLPVMNCWQANQYARCRACGWPRILFHMSSLILCHRLHRVRCQYWYRSRTSCSGIFPFSLRATMSRCRLLEGQSFPFSQGTLNTLI